MERVSAMKYFEILRESSSRHWERSGSRWKLKASMRFARCYHRCQCWVDGRYFSDGMLWRASNSSKGELDSVSNERTGQNIDLLYP